MSRAPIFPTSPEYSQTEIAVALLAALYRLENVIECGVENLANQLDPDPELRNTGHASAAPYDSGIRIAMNRLARVREQLP